jgi:hypothetical protein
MCSGQDHGRRIISEMETLFVTCKPKNEGDALWSTSVTDELIVEAILEEFDVTVIAAPHYSSDRKRVFQLNEEKLKSTFSLKIKRCELSVSVTRGDTVGYFTNATISANCTPEAFSKVIFRHVRCGLRTAIRPKNILQGPRGGLPAAAMIPVFFPLR